MSLNKSYIYIRDNIWYNSENIFKVGITTSIKDRSNTYITGELYKGFYVKFYDRCIINHIETFFINNNLDFISKTEDEIKIIELI